MSTHTDSVIIYRWSDERQLWEYKLDGQWYKSTLLEGLGADEGARKLRHDYPGVDLC